MVPNIALRAYELWNAAGRPERRADEFYFQAEEEFRQQLEGYGLTTANILYRRPDHPWLLQTYVWQGYDLCPIFPKLNKFLNFWLEKLEGPLHSVTIAHARLIKPAEIRAVDGEFRLH